MTPAPSQHARATLAACVPPSGRVSESHDLTLPRPTHRPRRRGRRYSSRPLVDGRRAATPPRATTTPHATRTRARRRRCGPNSSTRAGKGR
eukprot:1675700-Prymnesium_polylepis.1